MMKNGIGSRSDGIIGSSVCITPTKHGLSDPPDLKMAVSSSLIIREEYMEHVLRVELYITSNNNTSRSLAKACTAAVQTAVLNSTYGQSRLLL